MKVRQHRGSLNRSMRTVEEIEPTYQALKENIKNNLNINNPEFTVKPYGFDKRINWDTHIVVIKDYGVYGFTDQNIKS